MGKRGNGEGSIYFDASVGVYRAAVTLPDGGRRRVSAKTRKACQAKLVELQRQLEAGVPVASGDRLGPFLMWWLGSLEAKALAGQKSPNTVDNARWAVETWIVPALGAKRLRELQPEDVEALLAKMVAKGRSRSAVNRVRTYFAQALTVAERRGKVARNVARVAEMPATVRPADRRSLTQAQAKSLLLAAEGHRLEALYVTGLMLGLRPGELTGLRWVDVDLEAGQLSVQGSMKRERSGLRLGETKTPKSRRTLTIPAAVATALAAHQGRQLDERRWAGDAWVDTGLVFTTEIGTPLDPANLRHGFARLSERAGLGHWTPNELRHSTASLLSAGGVRLEVIADVLGHTSTRMLEQHYRHQVRPTIDAHVEVMADLF
ncbi:MAG: tyrosine-type recombinase/integrase [Acidimicrobiales bacterium]